MIWVSCKESNMTAHAFIGKYSTKVWRDPTHIKCFIPLTLQKVANASSLLVHMFIWFICSYGVDHPRNKLIPVIFVLHLFFLTSREQRILLSLLCVGTTSVSWSLIQLSTPALIHIHYMSSIHTQLLKGVFLLEWLVKWFGISNVEFG